MQTATAKPTTFRPLAALQNLYTKFVILMVIGMSSSAFAQTAPNAQATKFQTEADKHATTFCSFVNVLPKSKWVTLGALVMFLLGMALMIFGGRGGNVYLMRALAVIVIVPSALSLASAFGIVC